VISPPTPSRHVPAAPGFPAPAERLEHALARRLRSHGLACCAWLLLAAAGWFGALAASGVRLSPALLALGTLVPALGFALWASPVRPARRYTLNLVAATLFLPIGLMFAAAAVEPDVARSAPAHLDATALFDGALRVRDSDLASAGVLLARQGEFADGSELRLLRHPDAETARHHVATLAQALRGEPYADHGRRGVRLRDGVLPGALILIEQHGADVLELRARDLTGGLARLVEQRVPAPPADAPAAVAPVRWPGFVAATLAHALAFVALIFWGGRWTTRVDADPGVRPVNLAALRARLASFVEDPHAPLRVVESGADGLTIDVALEALRSHRIALTFDTRRREVRVAERVGAHGARPRDEDEASMRSPVDDPFDASRPQADRVWQTTWQATLIEPQRLAAVPLGPLGLHARLPAPYAAALDGEGVLTALCALVTRSGWHWQPRLGPA
jgi:hypothetical protein